MTPEDILLMRALKDNQGLLTDQQSTGLGAAAGAGLGLVSGGGIKGRMAGALIGAMMGGGLGWGVQQIAKDSPAGNMLAKIQSGQQLSDYDRQIVQSILAESYGELM